MLLQLQTGFRKLLNRSLILFDPHVQKLGGLLHSITEPHASVGDSSAKLGLRLVTTISLLSLLITPLVFFADLEPSAALWITMANSSVAAFLYVLARSRWHWWAIPLGSLVCAIGNYSFIVASSASPVIRLFTVLVPILFYSLVWRAWLTCLLAAVHIAIASLILVATGVNNVDFELALLLVFISTAMIAVSAYIRQQTIDTLAHRTAALIESEARFRGTIESSFDGIFLLDGVRDGNGKLIDLVIDTVNVRGMNIFVRNKQLIGQSVSNILSGISDQETLLFYLSALETRQPSDVEFMPPAGYISATWVRQQVVPIPNRDEIAVILSDISERKAAEELLRRREQEFRTLAENLPYQIGRLGRDHRFLYANNLLAQSLACTAEMVIGKRIEDIDTILPEARARIAQAVDAAFTTDDANNVEYSTEIKGLDNTYETRFIPERDDSGTVQSVLSIVINVTNARRAEAQRLELAMEQEKVRLLRQFIGDASHDLMTPLTVIKNSLFLMKEVEQTDRWQGYADQIARQSDHLETMIRDMLLLIKLEDEAKDSVKLQRINLNILVATFVNDYQPIVYKKKQHIYLECANEDLWVQIDSYKMIRVLTNLVHNAVKFTPQHGKISIRTGCTDVDNIYFQVEDTGVGISAEDLPRIFERFFKGMSHRPNEGGSGLGLSIVRRIVEAHSGQISVDSTLGIGTTFRVTLPKSIELAVAEPPIETYFQQTGN